MQNLIDTFESVFDIPFSMFPLPDFKLYSLRQVAGRIGIEPSYLSKIERGEHQAYANISKCIKISLAIGSDMFSSGLKYIENT